MRVIHTPLWVAKDLTRILGGDYDLKMFRNEPYLNREGFWECHAPEGYLKQQIRWARLPSWFPVDCDPGEKMCLFLGNGATVETLDLYRDEFLRLATRLDSLHGTIPQAYLDEMLGICRRAALNITAKNPLIQQRDRAERERDLLRGQVQRWNDVGYGLPDEGEWVLHRYDGAYGPVFGLFERGRFHVGAGPDFRKATHWLRVPKFSDEAGATDEP